RRRPARAAALHVAASHDPRRRRARLPTRRVAARCRAPQLRVVALRSRRILCGRMKVSILIAAHKPGAQIADALASARAHVHAEWELMVIDRSPPNENAAVVNDFAREVHARIEYEPLEEGAGSAAARNRLLELATGDAVAFLEPGDTWAPRHLATAVQFLSTDADVVVSDIRFFDRNSGHVVGECAMPAQLATNPIRALFGRETIASPSCVVVRRNIAERVNAFDPRYRVGEA